MTATIKLKKSSVSNNAPGTNDIDYGELAINYADGNLYYKNSSNVIKNFADSDNVQSSINAAITAAGSYNNASVDTHLNQSTAGSGEVLSWNGSDYDWVSATDSTKLPLAGGTMSGDIDGGGNKVLFANVYSATGDLPSASTYHGMFAHVHGTGKGYFAHAGSWVALANDADKLNLSGGTMTGNLTVPNLITSGNVDGRDVSVDGAKLDNIESNAKDDQTITAGSGLAGGGTGDVTLSHADTSSQASSNNSGRTYIQDITLDTYGHITGLATATETVTNTNLTHTGEVTGSTSLTISDNVVDEANLKVSNSPTNGYVLTAQSGNTGGLTWAAVSSGGNVDSAQTVSLARGAVSVTTGSASGGGALSYNSSSGVFTFNPSTNSGGLSNVVEDTTPQLGGNLDLNSNDITGTGNISINGSTTLSSTDAGSAAGPDLILYRNSSSPADGDYLGQIQFKGRHDGSGDEIYAKVTGKIADASSGTEDGLIETAIKGNGSFTIVSRQRSDELQLINGVGLSVAGSLTASGLSYPTSDGSTNQVLTTDGSGNLSFSTVASGGGGIDSAAVTALVDSDYVQARADIGVIGDANTVILNEYTGDSSATAFTLTHSPATDQHAIVMIDGVVQQVNNYSLSGSQLTLDEAPVTGAEVEVRTLRMQSGAVTVRDFADYIYQPSSATTTFSGADINAQTLLYNVNKLDVYKNGARLVHGLDYTATNGTSVTLLGDAADSGDTINISSFASSTINGSRNNTVLSTTTASQTVDTFNKTVSRSAKYIVQMTQGSRYHSQEVMLIHDGTTVSMTKYADIYTDSDLGTVDADISGNLVRLQVSPNYTNTTVKTHRTEVGV